MKKQSKIVSIGNSQGIRIPKLMLEMSGIVSDVEIQVKPGELKIVPIAPKQEEAETLKLSEKVLSQDWNRAEEDEAWENL